MKNIFDISIMKFFPQLNTSYKILFCGTYLNHKFIYLKNVQSMRQKFEELF